MKKQFTTYQELCTQYYDLDKPTIPADEWNLYLSYAKESSGLILEPMCGSGRLLLPLAQAGFQVEGFDASDIMLAALYRKANEQELSVVAWQQLVQELTFVDRYDLCLIPLGSFNLITDWQAIRASLKALYNSLRPGAVFVAELLLDTITDSVPIEVPVFSEVSNEQGKKITLKTVYNPLVDGVCKVDCDYTLFKDETEVTREHEQYQLRFYTQDVLITLMQEAGFVSVNFFKPFDRGVTPANDDYVVICEAKK